MHRQTLIALAHPVYGPTRQFRSDFIWQPERLISAGLSVNIGME